MIIAIQFLDQLGGAQKAVFGNVDSIFVLKANALDESIISRIIKSDIELDSYEALVRLGGQKTTKIKLKPLDDTLRGWEEINKILKKFEIKEEKVDNREEIKTNKNIIEEKDIFKIRKKIEIDTSIKIEKTGKNIKRISIRITQQEKMNLDQNCNISSIPIFLKYLILTETNLLEL